VKCCEAVTELCAWGADAGVDRGALSVDDLRGVVNSSSLQLRNRTPFVDASPVVSILDERADPGIAGCHATVASSGFFDGFDWKLAMVDLTKLVAFQRRVIFSTGRNGVT
jgi:hypothetical protein